MKKDFLQYKWINLLILTAVGFAVYSNSLQSEFHYDDMTSIIVQSRITTFKIFSDFNYWINISNRPLSDFTFAINYHFGKLNVIGYHLLNIIIHVFNGWLVYLLVLKIMSFRRIIDDRLFRNRYLIAFFSALIFLVHPIQTESVTYVVQRMTSLSSLFYFLAVYLYILGRLEFLENQRKWKSIILLFAACCSGLLGLLSKQDAITFPAAFIMAELFFIRRPDAKICRKYLLTVISALSIIILTIILAGKLPVETPIISRQNYLLTQFRVIYKYMQLSVLPINLNLDYDFKISTSFWNFKVIGSLLLILAVIGSGIILYRKFKPVSFGIFWYFLTLSVSSSLIPIKDVIFEHRLYMPMFGYSIILVYLISYFLIEKRQRMYVILMSLIALSYAAATYNRNIVWKTEYGLWRDVIKKSPNKARPWCNIGYAVLNMDSLDQAERYFEKSLELDPHLPLALNNLGHTWSRKGNPQKALPYFLKAVENDPHYVNALNNVGCTYIELKRSSESISYFERAIILDPDFLRTYYNISRAYIEMHDLNKAVEYLTRYLKLQPNDPDGLNNLGKCYFDQGKYNEALDIYLKALKISPDDYIVLNNMGNAYFMLGNPEKAIEFYKLALKINPDYKAARINLNRIINLQKEKK
jgi:tetratricopeptide (TPR) repeat protein